MGGFTSETKSLKTESPQNQFNSEDNIVIQIFPRFKRFISSLSLQKAITVTMDSLQLEMETGSYLGIVISDDKTIKDLNLRYRGLDEITDVLSFSTIHQGNYYGVHTIRENPHVEFPNPGGTLQPVGEVIISYPQAKRQALERKIPINQEVITLLVHGTLHVFGFDHENSSDLKTMENTQNSILATIDQITPTNPSDNLKIDFPIGIRGEP